jgi:uncharacterized Tic20 family protein
LNFQITIMLVLFAFVLVLMIGPSIFPVTQGIVRNTFSLFPPTLILLMGLFTTYQALVNTVRALSDKPIRYPLSLPFVK